MVRLLLCPEKNTTGWNNLRDKTKRAPDWAPVCIRGSVCLEVDSESNRNERHRTALVPKSRAIVIGLDVVQTRFD